MSNYGNVLGKTIISDETRKCSDETGLGDKDLRAVVPLARSSGEESRHAYISTEWRHLTPLLCAFTPGTLFFGERTEFLLENYIFVAFAVLAAASEAEDVEQKKRGASKTSNVNTLPTGVQKDFTYSIFTQNPQATSVQTFSQSQPHGSFYPSQNAQAGPYYSSQSQQETTQLHPRPQVHPLSSSSTSQFLPVNLDNSAYQPKYQSIPSKSTNPHIQLAIVPQSSVIQSSMLPYPQTLFTPNSYLTHPPIVHQPFNANYQYSPSMLLIPQINPLSNYFYPSQSQHLYYQNTPSKYNLFLRSPLVSHQEYEKTPVTKENDYSSKASIRTNLDVLTSSA
ncbi:hypothetical protein EVAR_53907_1 [Eumeta japonica]|uniref:Uncharacterized protein n=1 Tax=Eumeta variegata TaxID=151549 RepID=A0A4C1YBV0_EUMVA|nr:hypothetical protein EVAR_53907_1 [Eumeta japonica]